MEALLDADKAGEYGVWFGPRVAFAIEKGGL